MLAIVIGALFMVAGPYIAYSHRRLSRVGERVGAEVVDQEWQHTGSGLEGNRDGVYHPVVVFRTVGGEKVRASVLAGGSPPPARVGEQVEVIYDPARPWMVDLCPLGSPKIAVPVAMAVVGAAIALSGVYQMVS